MLGVDSAPVPRTWASKVLDDVRPIGVVSKAPARGWAMTGS